MFCDQYILTLDVGWLMTRTDVTKLLAHTLFGESAGSDKR
jgi:hypothetical protein